MSVPARCEFRLVSIGKVLAFVNVHYGDFVIKDFKVMQSNNGGEPWVAMPSKLIRTRNSEEDRWMVTAWINDGERKKAFEQFVLQAYYRELEQQGVPAPAGAVDAA